MHTRKIQNDAFYSYGWNLQYIVSPNNKLYKHSNIFHNICVRWCCPNSIACVMSCVVNRFEFLWGPLQVFHLHLKMMLALGDLYIAKAAADRSQSWWVIRNVFVFHGTKLKKLEQKLGYRLNFNINFGRSICIAKILAAKTFDTSFGQHDIFAASCQPSHSLNFSISHISVSYYMFLQKLYSMYETKMPFHKKFFFYKTTNQQNNGPGLWTF